MSVVSEASIDLGFLTELTLLTPDGSPRHSVRKPFKGLVRIHADGFDARVYCPIMAAGLVWALPREARRWDPEGRCWLVDAEQVDRLVRWLSAAGYSVRVIRPGEPTPPVQLRTRCIRGAW